MTLKEMPKVGDKIRYMGVDYSFITGGKVYEVTRSSRNSFYYVDNDGEELDCDKTDFHDWDLVTEEPEPQPDVTGLIANLGRRVHELEGADAVNSPKHYTQGDIEVIDYIDQVADGYPSRQAVYAANVLKYVSRAPYKNGAIDIRKAIWYAQRLADAMEAEASE